MEGYRSVKETASSWNISERRVTELCRNGRIEGAVKNGRKWLIPIYSVKPTAESYVCDGYIDYQAGPYPMVQGGELFTAAVDRKYFVDKTLLIRDVLRDPSVVLLFTRPRRFGKSLNLDMLKVFLEKTDSDDSIYFRGRKIWKEEGIVHEHMGRYPVIYMTFKEMFETEKEGMFDRISRSVGIEYSRHIELENSDILSDMDKLFYRKAVGGELNQQELRSSLFMLSRMLHIHHGEKVVIMLDEYDVPIAQGNSAGFLEEMISFMRGFLGQALKTNPHLMKGILTGIMRVSKESIFSGLNNVVTYSILDDKYSEYFGFTEEEIVEAARYYGCEDKLAEIEKWYNGYIIGSRRIYNPWSVARYFNNSFTPGAYWENESENAILREMLGRTGKDAEDALLRLLDGESIPTLINTSVVYPVLGNDLESIYSMLVVSGYLRAEKAGVSLVGLPYWNVSIPNLEISSIWNREIMSLLGDIWSSSTLSRLQLAVMQGNVESIESSLSDFLKSSVSFYDTAKENFYHGFILGLTVLFRGYHIRSNRESGNGRFDVMLIPENKYDWPGIIIEIKALPDASHDDLTNVAQKAICQIHEKEYASELKALNLKKILCYGVAFSSKDVALASSRG